MKTEITNQKNNLTKLIKVLGIGALISLSLAANSQCIAQFTYNNDTANSSTVYFTDASTIGYTQLTYFWDFGDGTSSNLENPIHTFANVGTSGIIVCLTVADTNGTTCTFCDSLFTDNPTMNECQADFTNTVSGNTATFVNNAVGGTNYYWNFGDGTTGSGQTATHTYYNPGTYNVCFIYNNYSDSINTNDTCQYCETIVIGNQSGCQASFTNTVSGNTVSFINSAVNGSYYTWDLGDGIQDYGQTATHTYTYPGTYTVCFQYDYYDSLNVWDTCNFCETIVVGPQANGIVESQDINTVIENYPNPFSESTTINYSISKAATVELTILDLMGNKIAIVENRNKSAGKYSTLWNAENASKGMYLLELKVNNQISTKKIIITN